MFPLLEYCLNIFLYFRNRKRLLPEESRSSLNSASKWRVSRTSTRRTLARYVCIYSLSYITCAYTSSSSFLGSNKESKLLERVPTLIPTMRPRRSSRTSRLSWLSRSPVRSAWSSTWRLPTSTFKPTSAPRDVLPMFPPLVSPQMYVTTT